MADVVSAAAAVEEYVRAAREPIHDVDGEEEVGE